MEASYLLAPIIGYFVAGSLKFSINIFKTWKWDFSNIGMGGMPSTHNTITSSTFFTLAFGEGWQSPIVAVALAVCIVVGIDSTDLRRKIESHAKVISMELGKVNEIAKNIRTRIGHSPLEVIAGWAVGAVIGYLLTFY